MTQARFSPLGDSALVVEFGDSMDIEINLRVQRLAASFLARPPAGVGEAVPSYRSVLLHYDPEQLDYAAVVAAVTERLQGLQAAAETGYNVIEIPVHYGGPDLGDVARLHGLTPAQVIQIHSSREYRVYMIGFTPGFPYLGEVDDAIATPRLPTPRTYVPAGSVGIAGRQTGIYPIDSPGGWRLIGSTPLELFNLEHDPPSLLAPGDVVRFVPIDSGAA